MTWFQPPRYQAAAGLATEYGTMIPPGANVVGYVRASGPQSQDHPDIKKNLYLTLNQALAKCRSGMGDVVFVMPTHAENISTAAFMSNLVAGTNIIGLGSGKLRPSFTWTADTATWLFNKANTKLTNCILNMAGDGTGLVGTPHAVAAPITVSASGCEISDCYIVTSTAQYNTATIPITTTAGGTDLKILRNRFIGATAGENTTMVRLVGADRLEFSGNTMVGATSNVAVGVVQFITTDSLFIRMFDNVLRNNKASSTACVTISAGATSSSGEVDRLFMTTLGNGANQLVLGHADGAWAASTAVFSFGRFINVVNLAGERAAEVTVVSA